MSVFICAKNHGILDVSKNCTQEELKKAYHVKIKKCHPDVGGDLEEFLMVQIAYEEILVRIEQKNARIAFLKSLIPGSSRNN